MMPNTLYLRFTEKGTWQCSSCENIRHVKILPWFSVVQSVEGSYDISLENGPAFHTGSGGFFLAPANVQQNIIHHVSTASGRMIFRWIFFDLVINGSLSLDVLYEFPVLLPTDAESSMNRLFDALFKAEDVFREYSCYYQIVDLLMSLHPAEKATLRPEMEQTLAYLQENFQKKITVADLASHIHMSEPNFYAMFKKQFHLSPMIYLNQYRMSVAAELLRQSDCTVSSIAQETGFSNPLYFSKSFRQFYHISPSEYRLKYALKKE